EENALHTRYLAEFLGQFSLQRDAIDVGAMNHPTSLLTNGVGNGRMGMAQAADSDAAEGVEIFVPLRIIEPGPFSALKGDRDAAVGIHERLVSHLFFLCYNAKRQHGLPV